VVERFEADPESILRAQGWAPGSTNAQLFERRLRQAEATGWFGFANAYGSMMAALVPGLLGVCIAGFASARRGERQSGEPGFVLLLALGALVGLALSGSKGAWGAGVVGVALLGMLIARPKLPGAVTRSLPVVALALPIFVLGLVVVRGLIGERIGELSIYFRWQYLTGAVRIVADHPLFGVGPDGFKDAYLVAKPPTSPEEVESPHSLFLDWVSTLGVLGLAWVMAWWLWLGEAAGKLRERPTEAQHENESADRRPEWLWVAGVVLASVVTSQIIGWRNAAPTERFLVPLAGLVWLCGTMVVARLLARGALRLGSAGLVCGAVALAAHSMIEITPVLPGAAGLAIAIWALGASPETGQGRSSRARLAPVWGVLPLIGAVTILVFGVLPAQRWQRHLHSGADEVRLIGEVAGLSGDPTDGAFARADAERLIRAVAARYDAPLPSTEAEVEDLLARLRRDSLDGAIGALRRVVEVGVAIERSLVLVARLEPQPAGAAMAMGELTKAMRSGQAALAGAERETDLAPRSAGAWGRLGAMHRALAEMSGDQTHLREPRRAWRRAAVFDPHGLSPPRNLARLSAALGDAEGAARWARRALEVDRNLRLDPLKGLSEREREEMERLASGPA